jgi:hypothetical protein
MHLPTVYGSLRQSNYYIYTACDTKYFDSFGAVLINSVHTNTDLGIHVHLFNPTEKQLDCCNKPRVSVTYEYVDPSEFAAAAKKWNSTALGDLEKIQLDRTLNAMRKGQDQDILERMQKTYYACARFVRLCNMFDQSASVLAIDVDAVVRDQPLQLDKQKDFYIHQITGKKARILAGGVFLNPSDGSQQFLTDYAENIKTYLNKDYIYWGLDQDILDQVVPKYNYGQLPIEYIDWNMQPSSYIWTAKGKRKELLSFVNESARYKSE